MATPIRASVPWSRVARRCQCSNAPQALRRRYAQSHHIPRSIKQSQWSAAAGALVVAGVGVTGWNFYQRELLAEAPPGPPEEIKIETPKTKKGLSKEDNRALLSSQHYQVMRSWENPGVYTWGSNAGKVVAPDTDEAFVKNPRRIAYFDGALLRDLKMSQRYAAAINERGDLLQWGNDYAPDTKAPRVTLRNKGLVSLSLSSDRIIALSSTGDVFSIPVSKADQEAGGKPYESTWLPFWSTQATISYRKITPKLSWNEQITSVSAGLSHALMLSSNGRLFSAAASTTNFPSLGQLGVPGLTWMNRPEGPFDQPHEIGTLQGFEIKAIASGDNHSLALDKAGRVFAFGDNSSGQLGFEPMAEVPYVDAPSLLPIARLYQGTAQVPVVTSVAAGGSNSFFTIDATRVAQPNDPMNAIGKFAPAEPARNPLLGRVTADTWACGSGILGSLGNGRWTHIQGTPIKIKALSGLFEFDERNNTVIPIRLDRLSAGATHAAAIMSNVTYLGARAHTSEADTNWGADVLWWGGNEYYQVGTGKRSNISNPVYIGPLDGPGVDGTKREEHRFQITPRHRVSVNGRSVSFEQRVQCGRYVTAVYSAV